MNYKRIYYPESRLNGFSNIDGTIAFYNQVNALLKPDSIVVDIGCGRGAYGEDSIPFRRNLRILKGKCQCVIGIDLNPAASENPFLDEFRLIKGEHWPLEDELADLLVSDNVLEHVADPGAFFSECYRVLKPGGYVAIRTPNVLSYFGIISKLVPNPQHISVLRRAKDRVNEEDTFPTVYRCNTLRSLRQALAKHGFEPTVYGFEAEPAYLSFSRLFYYFGVLYQHFAPNFLRVGLHAFGRKLP